ncbi:MAG: hypothetical protein ABSH35_09200, partial [Isosphaeraceae bacterium]
GKGAHGLVHGPNSLNATYIRQGRISDTPRKLARDLRNGHLGSVDASKPDEIQNPKQHLKQLLRERAYTAVVSEEIARTLDPRTIDQRSPSFHGFAEAVRNGQLAPPAQAGRERVGQ